MYLALSRYVGSDDVKVRTFTTLRDCLESARLALEAISAPFSIEFFRFNEDEPSELGVFLFVLKNYQDEKVS